MSTCALRSARLSTGPRAGTIRVSVVGHGLQPLKAADDAANPSAGPPVHDRPALPGDGIAHREHVLLRKVDVQIAVRVRRIGDVAVADTGVELAGRRRRSCSVARLRQLLEALSVPGPGDVLLQPEPRVLVRNDRRAGLAQPLVRAGLLGMPMRIEERVNRTAAGQAGDALSSARRKPRGSAIDEQHAARIGLRDNIGFAGESEDEQIVGSAARCLRRRAPAPAKPRTGDASTSPATPPIAALSICRRV